MIDPTEPRLRRDAESGERSPRGVRSELPPTIPIAGESPDADTPGEERARAILDADATPQFLPRAADSDAAGEENANRAEQAVRHVKVDPTASKLGRFGDYELLEEIARGGMGVVYKARHVKLQRAVALKMILAGTLASDEEVRRFYAEAQAAARLDHPGIVPVYEVGERDGRHFYSMAFVEGTSLAHRLADGPLPPNEAARLILAAVESVAHAHRQGVIHRDLKPGNILLQASDGAPKVTDFGLAKRLETDDELTATGQILGTPSYMPPEQARGDAAAIAPAADVYALGAVLYCSLTGRPPFQAASPIETVMQVLNQEPPSPRRLNPNLPIDLETICLKCLEKEPARRFFSADDLADELRRFLEGRPIQSRPVSPTSRAWRWCRRNPALSGTIAAALATLAVVTGVYIGSLLEKNRELAQAVVQANQATGAANKAKDDADSERRKAVDAKAEAERERDAARRAGEELQDRLCISFVQQASAANAARVPGYRWEVRDLIARAVELLRRERPADIKTTSATAELPSEATIRSVMATSLAHRDLRLIYEFQTGGLLAPALSADGTFAALLASDFRFTTESMGPLAKSSGLVNLSTGKEVTSWASGLTDLPMQSSLGPDGNWLAGAVTVVAPRVPRGTMRVHVWEAAAGGQLQRRLELPGETGEAGERRGVQVEFSPDGKWLAAAHRGRSNAAQPQVVVWDTSRWDDNEYSPQTLVAADKEVVSAIAWSRDSQRLVVSFQRGDAVVVNVGDASESAVVKPPTGIMSAVVAGPEDLVSMLVAQTGSSASSPCRLVVWNTATNEELVGWNAWAGSSGGFSGPAFAPSGDLLAYGDFRGTLRVFDWRQRRELFTVTTAHHLPIQHVGWTADSSRLITCGKDGWLKVWELSDRSYAANETSILTKLSGGHAAFSPDGRWIAIADRQRGETQLVDAAANRVVWRAKLFGQPVFDSNSQRLAVAAETTVLFDISSLPAGESEPTELLRREIGEQIVSPAFNRDGELLAVRSVRQNQPARTTQISVVNVSRNETVYVVPADRSGLSASLSPRADRLLVSFGGAPASTWQVIELPSGRDVGRAEGPTLGLIALPPVFSADGSLVAIAYHASPFRTEPPSPATGKSAPNKSDEAGEEKGPATHARHSPNHHSHADDHLVFVIRMEDGKAIARIGNARQPTALAFRDRQTLAIADQLGSIRFVSLSSGDDLMTIDNADGDVSLLSFVEDGAELIVGAIDSTWRFDLKRLDEQLRPLRLDFNNRE